MIFIPSKEQECEPQIEVNSVHEKNGNTNNTKVNLNQHRIICIIWSWASSGHAIVDIATNKVSSRN